MDGPRPSTSLNHDQCGLGPSDSCASQLVIGQMGEIPLSGKRRSLCLGGALGNMGTTSGNVEDVLPMFSSSNISHSLRVWIPRHLMVPGRVEALSPESVGGFLLGLSELGS